MIEKILRCLGCDKPFLKRGHAQKFCCVSCRDITYLKGCEEKTCPGCAHVFKCAKKERVCCSVICDRKIRRSNRILVTCETCLKTIDRKPSSVKGRKIILCSNECRSKFLLHDKRSWAIEKKDRKVPKHKMYKRISVRGKWVKEHRLVMERHLGRKMDPSEHIHHINGDGLDNRVENLQVVSNREHHMIEILITGRKRDKV